MKIKPEHYTELSAAVLGQYSEAAARKYQAAGLSPMRFRWDMLWASRIRIGDGRGMDGLPIYEYANDDHIDTALRRIMQQAGDIWAATR